MEILYTLHPIEEKIPTRFFFQSTDFYLFLGKNFLIQVRKNLYRIKRILIDRYRIHLLFPGFQKDFVWEERSGPFFKLGLVSGL
ncbi:hypothetical protein LEP1GSC036_0737 [Leptospira weilii str. 2006001853]|uniref:Uncharacterized protein n=3 Tax=Leptospira weilii TaxID=28184 RepID=A0A828Z4B6_9LEPT|nr:hypothetical protein LEP1GSC036_0737 [Leptospira weilii str. 2006001853]EMM74912.1 hypothetical protein LEP1GSC038_0887 [Leptospira weilii str. 2006001855]EMN46585.1 hypothetical protein LEP1GSC086_4104 [Leptospira weilii str. LNT 1234]EMN90851.1 hypothetical protein LEP1GSC108_2300 [Leptospira weilii str. UI 13098]OMI17866.1 hypothetical protein BUQ74_07965 [Leptospira weilii serovar Heyan]